MYSLPIPPPHLPPLRQDPRKVLGPRRPAKHTLGVVMTRLVAEHGAFAGGVGARSMPWVVAPRQQVAFESSLEGRGGVAVFQSLKQILEIRNFSVRKHVSGCDEIVVAAADLELVYGLENQLHFKDVCAHIFLAKVVHCHKIQLAAWQIGSRRLT